MSLDDIIVGKLVDLARQGDETAVNRLLSSHRERLRQMVSLRIDPRIKARVDASDIVQDTLAEAANRLTTRRDKPEGPFYPWLRQLAWNRLTDASRRHIEAQRRSVLREEPWFSQISDQSAVRLADRLISSGTSPSGRIQRLELRRRVKHALRALPAQDRELLLLRYVEQLSPGEVAAVLDVSERTFRWRHRRALDRLLDLLGDCASGEVP